MKAALDPVRSSRRWARAAWVKCTRLWSQHFGNASWYGVNATVIYAGPSGSGNGLDQVNLLPRAV